MPISRRKFMALSGAAAGVSAVDLTAFAENIFAWNDYRPAFPRLGIIAIGVDQTYPPANWPTFAKFHAIIINGSFAIWGDSRAYTREDVVRGIKANSRIDTKVFQYVGFNTISSTGAGFDAADPSSFFSAANRNNWWLYQNGTSGPTVPTGTQTYINMTHFSPRDPITGFYPYEAAAAYSESMFHSGNALHPRNAAPSLDGFFLDNVYSSPRVNGDWNRDGVTDSDTDPAIQQAVRTGERDFPYEMSKLAPHLLVLGNNGSWAQLSTTDPNAIAPLNNVFSGGVLEALIGAPSSVETFAGFNEAMAYYRFLMDVIRGPKIELINQEKLQTDGSDPYDPTPYHAMRYGLCLTLMNDGYYTADGIHGHTGELDQILWFDEWDGGGIGEGYLGQPTRDWRGAVQSKPRWAYGSLGVWAREFAGGIAIVNPKGNGPQTITFQDLGGARWKHINGAQDPETNDGQNIMNDITLADRDGIILLRRHNLGF